MRVVVTVLACALLAPTSAFSSPLEDESLGGAVFTGAASPHATSTLINPAAMSLAGVGWHIYVGSSARISQLSVDRELVDPDSGALVPGPNASTIDFTPGGLISAYNRYQEGHHIGFTLGTTFAERFPANTPELGYHVLGGHLYQGVFAFHGSYKINRRFRFGAAAMLSHSYVKYSFQRDTALEGGRGAGGLGSDCGGSPCGLENPDATETYDLSTSTELSGFTSVLSADRVGVSVGMLIETKRNWWFGISYFTPPGTFSETTTSGSAKVQAAPRDGGATSTGRAEIAYRLPQSLHLALRGPLLEGYELLVGVRLQNTSRHRQLDIRMFGAELADAGAPEWYPRFRGFRDTMQISAGLEQLAGRSVRLGGRLRFDTGATRDRRVNPLQVEPWNLTALFGAELRPTDAVVLGIGYGLSWAPATSVGADSDFSPNARLDCVDSGFSFEQCEAVRDGRATGSAAGRYSRFLHTVTLSMRYDLL